jgi:hypothetical protein
MDEGEKPIHFASDIFEMGRKVPAHVNGLFAEASAELSYICDGRGIQRPKSVFVECLNAFCQANLNAIQEKVVLPQEVLLLNFRVQFRVVSFPDAHNPAGRL